MRRATIVELHITRQRGIDRWAQPLLVQFRLLVDRPSGHDGIVRQDVYRATPTASF
jgi:hypothetical protein